MTWRTVAPLSDYFYRTLLCHLPIALAEGVLLRTMPEYAQRPKVIEMFGWYHREALANRTFYALEATGDGPDRYDRDPVAIRGIARLTTAVQALWLARPANLEYELLIHFEGDDLQLTPGFTFDRRAALPEYAHVDVQLEDLTVAARLHSQILKLPRDGTLWLTLALVSIAREVNYMAIKYLMSWVAVEALFGSVDTHGVTKRLVRRVSRFFPGDEVVTAKRVEELYDLRSRIAHGLRGAETLAPALFESQEIVRRALVRALEDHALGILLDGDGREPFLDGLK